jgi:arylsulfatase A-like enzyme
MNRWFAVLAVCGSVLIFGSGCGDGASSPSEAKNVVVISIDTLRPDMLGAYGYERPSSPFIDAFAERGVLFKTAVTPTPWTLPAHASLLTGLYPRRHRVRGHTRELPLQVNTLAQLLQAAGYETASIYNTHHLDTRYGLHRGFDHLDYVPEDVGQIRPADVFRRARKWLEDAPEPFFLLLHTYDVHSDYRSLPAYEAMFTRESRGRADGTTEQLTAFREGKVRLSGEDASGLEDFYVAGIRQVDEALKPVFELFEHTKLGERTFVWLTSDHGEEFFEHGAVLHGHTHFEELMRVPLLLSGPEVPSALHVEEAVSLIDVLPTTLSLLGLAPHAGLDGRDLSPLLRGEASEVFRERILFGESNHNNEKPTVKRSARYRNFKLVRDMLLGTMRLYDLDRDPEERIDVKEEHPEMADMLLARLEQLETAEAPMEDRLLPALDPDEADRLRALGYVP